MTLPAGLVLAGAAVTLASGQSEPPAFKSTTKLVEVSVVALDAKGAPVRNLRKEQFTILDEGKPRAVAFFRYEGGLPPAASAASTPVPGVFTNRVEAAGGPPRNITAIVLDSVNTEPADQMMVKAQTMQFLKRLSPQSRMAIYQMGKQFRVLQDFTDDAGELRAQLAKFRVDSPSQRLSDVKTMANEFDQMLRMMSTKDGINESLANTLETVLASENNRNATVQANRVETTLATLEAVGRHLSGIPGRKNLVWISGGIVTFTMRMSSRPMRVSRNINPAVGESFEDRIRKTAQRLAQDGVVLYAVNARQSTSGNESLSEMQEPEEVHGRFEQIRRATDFSADVRGAFGLMTSITGGRAVFNDLVDGVAKAENDLQGSYTLAFYAGDEADNRWHPLKISAAAPGVQLTHRQGYLSERDNPGDWAAEQVREALMSPLGSSAIHLTAECAPAEGGDSGTVRLALDVEAKDLSLAAEAGRRRGTVEVWIVEKTAAGQAKFEQRELRLDLSEEQYSKALEEGLTAVRKVWKPAPETRVLRVVVRDKETGQFGAVDIPLARVTPPPTPPSAN